MPSAGLAAFDVSPDGARVVFSYLGDIFFVDTQGAKPPVRFTHTKGAEGNVRFSPDCTRISFARDREIFVQSLSDGRLVQVSDGGASNYEWSKDGRQIVYSSPRTSRTQVLPNYSGKFVTAAPFQRDVVGDESTGGSSFIVSSEGGKPQQLDALPDTRLARGSAMPIWSPDGKWLASASVSTNSKKKQIVLWEAKTRKAKNITEFTDDRWVENWEFQWAPDSKYLLVSDDSNGFHHLFRIAIESGKPEQITKGNFDINHERFAYPPQWIGDTIYYSSTDGGGPSERHFYSISPDGSNKKQLSQTAGINVGAVSESGRYIAWMKADLKHPFDLYVDSDRVTDSVQKTFASYAWPETKFIDFPSPGDGKKVAAKILLPPGYNPDDNSGKQWPCMFFVHGAGIASSVLKQWGSYDEIRFVFNNYMANKGYVIMDIDYRGSTGYGRDWRTDIYLHMGGKDLDDVMGGVDYLRKLGNIDMNRLGMWGVSYGGFMTNMVLFQRPGVIKAGAGWAAVNDWENYNDGYTRQRLTTPKENPEAFRRSSPIHFSQNLKDNLLVVHGMGDSNVLFQDAVQLTEKMIQEGKRFDEIFYPQEDHAFVRDETLIDAYRRTAEWMDRHLK